jgi:tetratricopeptide (TPR) repeat protein
VLTEGNVELSKHGPYGPVTIAMLRPGEMFGEMGLIDGSARSATARAVGDVSVKVIPGAEFLRTIHDKPDAALSVMGNLIDRLRAANDMLVRTSLPRQIENDSPATPAAVTPAKKRPQATGLVSRLLGLATASRASRIEIMVANLPGDADGTHRQRLLLALGGIAGVRTRPAKTLIEPDPNADIIHQAAQASAVGRQYLQQNHADLLVWGAFDGQGMTYNLRFLSRVPEDEDRPGWFGNMLRLVLPADFSTALDIVVATTAITATVCDDDAKATTLRSAQPAGLEAIRNLPADALSGLTYVERGSVHACLGNIAADGARRDDNGALRDAIAHYRAALETIRREEAPLDWAITQRNLGVILQILAEREADSVGLTAAVEAFRAALQVISKDGFPQIWAAVQNRLGTALYRLDLGSDDDSERMKQAVSAFQAALQVYSRIETPLRWADVLNNVALAMQMLGGEARNPEILEKAVEACRAALEIRTREDTPLPWATTQNSLGSALFLLGKMRRNSANLEAAAEAFQQAYDLCTELNARRLATVAARNLSHVDRLLDTIAPRGVPKLWWEGEDDAAS